MVDTPQENEQKREVYNRISGFYRYFAGFLERTCWNRGIALLNVRPGESVLEIGFGTGHCLVKFAKLVGPEGKVYGIDISDRMVEFARKRVEASGLESRVNIRRGDAAYLPYRDDMVDVVFMSFTLELLPVSKMQETLEEVKRVLKPSGRFLAISVSSQMGDSLVCKFYNWVHSKWPQYVDCRPICLKQVMADAGFIVKQVETVKLLGFPIEIAEGILENG